MANAGSSTSAPNVPQADLYLPCEHVMNAEFIHYEAVNDRFGERKPYLTEFSKFGELAKELRLMIWKIVANSNPRNLGIWRLWDQYESNSRGSPYRYTSNHPVPAILHVSQESRAVGLKYYFLTHSAIGQPTLSPIFYTIPLNRVVPPQIYRHPADTICHMLDERYWNTEFWVHNPMQRRIALNTYWSVFDHDYRLPHILPNSEILLFSMRDPTWENRKCLEFFESNDWNFLQRHEVEIAKKCIMNKYRKREWVKFECWEWMQKVATDTQMTPARQQKYAMYNEYFEAIFKNKPKYLEAYKSMLPNKNLMVVNPDSNRTISGAKWEWMDRWEKEIGEAPVFRTVGIRGYSKFK